MHIYSISAYIIMFILTLTNEIKTLILIIIMLLFLCRGKQFRKEFSRLGEIRGYLSTKANIMALTATATKSTRKDICKSLGMIRPVLILLSPEKDNIIYQVTEKTEKDLKKYLLQL